MKAFLLDRYGKTGNTRIGDAPEPPMGDGDVLVRIHAASVNPLDFKIRDGDFKLILPYSAVVAAVGLTEGLLTLNLVDEITETKGNGSREALAQGASNMLNGFFTGMGGCPMIAQTLVNLNAGARSRVAGVVAAITIMAIVLVGAPVIEKIPMAALTGVMMVVAFFTFNWKSFKILNKMPLQDVVVMIVVTAVTIIWHNLALAVLIGIIISALSFAWKKAIGIQVRTSIDADASKRYALHGDLFFGSIGDFEKALDIRNDPQRVVLDFQHSNISDMGALESLNKMTGKYRTAGKSLVVENLDAKSRSLLQKAAGMSAVQVV